MNSFLAPLYISDTKSKYSQNVMNLENSAGRNLFLEKLDEILQEINVFIFKEFYSLTIFFFKFQRS